MDRAKILVLASHSSELVERFCSRAVWLESGTIRMDGPLSSVSREYHQSIT